MPTNTPPEAHSDDHSNESASGRTSRGVYVIAAIVVIALLAFLFIMFLSNSAAELTSSQAQDDASSASETFAANANEPLNEDIGSTSSTDNGGSEGATANMTGSVSSNAASDVQVSQSENATSTNENETILDESISLQPGTYTTYDAGRLADAARGDVVLFFHAPWCPTCRAADADINAKRAQIPDGLTILKVDYDSSTDMRRQYGITYQHTFVQVDEAGNKLQIWNGGALDEIQRRINN